MTALSVDNGVFAGLSNAAGLVCRQGVKASRDAEVVDKLREAGEASI